MDQDLEPKKINHTRSMEEADQSSDTKSEVTGILGSLIAPKSPNQSNTEVLDQKHYQTKNILSKILDDAITEQERLKNPELMRVRNNLLLLILVLSAYGIYYLIGDFINILLTAFIAGIAYQQTRQRFANFVMKKSSYHGSQQTLFSRISRSIIWLLLIYLLPKIRYLLSHPRQIAMLKHVSYDQLNAQIFESFIRNKNIVVFFCQIVLGFRIIYLLLGPHLKQIGRAISPKNKKFVNFLFLLISLMLTLIAFTVIPSILFRQVSSVGYLAQQKIEQKLGCQIISIQQHNNQTLPYCSQMITSQNQFIRHTIEEFKDQNQTIQKCIQFVKKLQADYIGQEVFIYDDIACTWYTFIHKAYNYSGISGNSQPSTGDLVLTGTNIFKTFFGNLTFILSGFSDFIFSATTFLTMFILTTQTFNTGNTLNQIFSEQKQQLVSSITNLIQATFLIVFQHFIVSVFLLELFNFTQINLIIATVLSSMAFFPFFRPWFGILIVTMIKMLITGQYWISIIFLIVYYFVSEKIYSIHYRTMQIHQIVTNMSVLFGIYRFGIAGIFYGPLIIIVYKCVEKQLMY